MAACHHWANLVTGGLRLFVGVDALLLLCQLFYIGIIQNFISGDTVIQSISDIIRMLGEIEVVYIEDFCLPRLHL